MGSWRVVGECGCLSLLMVLVFFFFFFFFWNRCFGYGCLFLCWGVYGFWGEEDGGWGGGGEEGAGERLSGVFLGFGDLDFVCLR